MVPVALGAWHKKYHGFLRQLRVIDCGGEGDCLFHSISQALKKTHLTSKDLDLSVAGLRKIAADQFESDPTQARAWLLEHGIQLYWDTPFFREIMQTHDLEAYGARGVVSAFASAVRTRGQTFWGDDAVLTWLTQSPALKSVAYVILSSTGKVHCQVFAHEPVSDTTHAMVLWNQPGLHWQLVGFEDRKLPFLFPVHKVPPVVDGMLSASGCGALHNRLGVYALQGTPQGNPGSLLDALVSAPGFAPLPEEAGQFKQLLYSLVQGHTDDGSRLRSLFEAKKPEGFHELCLRYGWDTYNTHLRKFAYVILEPYRARTDVTAPAARFTVVLLRSAPGLWEVFVPRSQAGHPYSLVPVERAPLLVQLVVLKATHEHRGHLVQVEHKKQLWQWDAEGRCVVLGNRKAKPWRVYRAEHFETTLAGKTRGRVQEPCACSHLGIRQNQK
jgi:hypothetical protein